MLCKNVIHNKTKNFYECNKDIHPFVDKIIQVMKLIKLK